MITKTTTEKISQKPIDYDIHIKYKCPKCSQEHWLSYLQSSTKNFKVVCSCGLLFRVKRVIGFDLRYKKKSKPVKSEQLSESVKIEPENIVKPEPVKIVPKPPVDLIEKAVKILVGYGFTENEADELLIKSYENNPVNDLTSLIKQTLEKMKL